MKKNNTSKVYVRPVLRPVNTKKPHGMNAARSGCGNCKHTYPK